MTAIRDVLVERIWHGVEPFANAERYLDRVDPQGWGFEHPYLTDMIDELRPALVVEVGVWKGASTAVMAHRMKTLGLPSVVLAVDTWLGSREMWGDPDLFEQLRIEDGYPTLYRTFVANMVKSGLTDYVVPLPLDSQSAAQVLSRHGFNQTDLVHIDAGHDYDAVVTCLHSWWPLVRDGGVLLGDDYCPDSDYWPGVVQAFDDFFGRDGIECSGYKCLVRK